MAKKNIYVCVQRDLVHPVNWSLREFENRIAVKYFDNTKLLATALEKEKDVAAIILDSMISNESTLEFARTSKAGNPAIKILLIVSSGTTKEDIVAIVQAKTVNGVLVRPFTAEQMSDYIYKLCGFQKATDVPWYMQTGMK